jgi:glycosyltransferase involved in cell wall biosynthesis
LAQSDPLVSFVVPTYNVAGFLPDCLKSILDQTAGVDYEVVLIDDASTDQTEQVARSFTDPRIRYIRHAENEGHAATINEAMSLARGALIARIDSDDRYRPDFLARVLPIFERFPDVGVVFGNVELIDESGSVSASEPDTGSPRCDARGNVLVRLLEKNFICAATVIGRREAWLATLPVPEWLAFHDWYFTLLMARRWNFYHVDRVLADYRVHASNYHTTIVKNRTEEPSIFWLIDRVFDSPEHDSAVEAAKRQARNRIYGNQYITLADKYFGLQMDGDARRCYLQAIRYQPHHAIRPDVARRLAGTFIGRKKYERGKSIAKSMLSRD